MSSSSSRLIVHLGRSPIALDVPSSPLSHKLHSDDDDEPSRPTHRSSESLSPRSVILPRPVQRKSTSSVMMPLRLSAPSSPLAFQVQISPPSPISLRFSLVAAASPRNSFLLTATTFRTQGFSIGHVGLFNGDRSPSQTRFAVHKGRPSALTLAPMATSFSDFELLGDSGRGASASVLKALRLDQIGLYVLKSIDVYSQEKRRQLVKELTTFADLQSANHVVQFFGAYYNEGRAMLVLEFMNRGSLQACVERIGPLPPGVVLHFARQMFAGLAHLHARHLVHRDIKPGNVLVSRRGRLKLTDFGISETVRSSSPYLDGFVGTQIYMSPERLEGAPYGTPADIWSAGLVLAFAALGQHPYSAADGFFGIVQQIRDAPIPALPDAFPDAFRHLLACCLQEQPEQRWTATQLLEHPVLDGVDPDQVLDWDLNQTTLQDMTDLSRLANVLVDKKYRNIDEPIQEAVRLEDLLELSRTLEIEPAEIRKSIVAAHCQRERPK